MQSRNVRERLDGEQDLQQGPDVLPVDTLSCERQGPTSSTDVQQQGHDSVKNTDGQQLPANASRPQTADELIDTEQSSQAEDLGTHPQADQDGVSTKPEAFVSPHVKLQTAHPSGHQSGSSDRPAKQGSRMTHANLPPVTPAGTLQTAQVVPDSSQHLLPSHEAEDSSQSVPAQMPQHECSSGFRPEAATGLAANSDQPPVQSQEHQEPRIEVAPSNTASGQAVGSASVQGNHVQLRVEAVPQQCNVAVRQLSQSQRPGPLADALASDIFDDLDAQIAQQIEEAQAHHAKQAQSTQQAAVPRPVTHTQQAEQAKQAQRMDQTEHDKQIHCQRHAEPACQHRPTQLADQAQQVQQEQQAQRAVHEAHQTAASQAQTHASAKDGQMSGSGASGHQAEQHATDPVQKIPGATQAHAIDITSDAMDTDSTAVNLGPAHKRPHSQLQQSEQQQQQQHALQVAACRMDTARDSKIQHGGFEFDSFLDSCELDAELAQLLDSAAAFRPAGPPDTSQAGPRSECAAASKPSLAGPKPISPEVSMKRCRPNSAGSGCRPNSAGSEAKLTGSRPNSAGARPNLAEPRPKSLNSQPHSARERPNSAGAGPNSAGGLCTAADARAVDDRAAAAPAPAGPYENAAQPVRVACQTAVVLLMQPA